MSVLDTEFLDLPALLALDEQDADVMCDGVSPPSVDGETRYLCTRTEGHEDEHIAFARVPIHNVMIVVAIWKQS